MPMTHIFKQHVGRAVGAGLLAVAIAIMALVSPTPAVAEEGRLRIAEQYGVVYLLLNVARDQQLIEKHGKAAGVDIKVDWVKLSGGAAVNDALLSGGVDIAAAGVGPLLTIWDRTHGRQNVKGVASLGNFPYYLVSNNPAVKSIADFTDKDRIAVPAVGVSVQSRVLQLASAKQWGNDQYAKLDAISVAVPHPDATAAIISGGTEISAHFGNPPFQDQELAENPKAHIVLNSYDVLGGPASSTVLFATEKFRNDSPKTYRAFLQALQEAATYVTAHPQEAADTYIRVTGAKLDRDFLVKVITNPDVKFTLQPNNTLGLAKFMHQIGAIKNAPVSWRDYFFEDPAIGEGS
ncbi:nitrate ABC transporter substrate-binding protein [Bordetella genomosp. 4]|uniref:Nitrate ABC transporter substrate-binding protein n=2 Tax=Bordetella genomosp. 4 TaxID=463044 RepID=A0A261V0B0_9BORD|nr:nitrate ABC transporter substrate-binding protein [Bordetella genomosp. 4]OZI67584.1 nitrate ABC transporter substrate-binding protein [Bordetella genomosp. 4]